MPVSAEQKEIIRQKIAECGCKKKAGCVELNLEDIAPVQKVEGTDLLECYTDRARGCRFALPFGKTYFCRCPVRNYLFRELDI